MGTIKKNAISVSELVKLVDNVKCCQFCSISYVTPASSLDKKFIGGKTNPFNGHVSAITSMSGIQINASYEKAVNNRIKGEKDFKAESLPWGEWFIPNKVITHKGKMYLRFYVTKSAKTEKAYYYDGERVDEEMAKDIASNIRESKPSARQAEVGISEEDMVKPFTVAAENISAITLNGTTYIVC